MTDEQTLEAVVIQLPDHAECEVCLGEGDLGDGEQCLECEGAGSLPSPPMPFCGHEACEPSAMTMAGWLGGEAGTGMPVYRCEHGHLTAVEYFESAEAA